MKDEKKSGARAARETNPNVLKLAILPRAGRITEGAGEIRLACVPALIDEYLKRLLSIFDALGRPFSSDEVRSLRAALEKHLDEGFRASQYARLVVKYGTMPPPHPGLDYVVSCEMRDIDIEYRRWVENREPPYFGAHPDAKVMALAAELGTPSEVPVLDVGAGSGRNTIPLAHAGFPTDAVELAAPLAEVLRRDVKKSGLPIEVYEGDILDGELALPKAHYKLIVLAEVVASHFRTVDQVRALMTRAGELLRPGGVLLYSAFVALDGYKPDALARQFSQLAWCTIFTRPELDRAAEGLPFDRLGDESVHDYERQHLPASQWPPTGWFVKWSRGSDVFKLPDGKAPLELRWISFRKR
jgi:SAM-dependent methyltransferase